MASRREEQQENARLRVMRLLSENPKTSTRLIAGAVGISNGSAYYVLKALIEKGFVKLESFNSNPRKRKYIYLLTPKGVQEKSMLTSRFVKRKRAEYEALRVEIEKLEIEIEATSSEQF